jgi:hypothetical protein
MTELKLIQCDTAEQRNFPWTEGLYEPDKREVPVVKTTTTPMFINLKSADHLRSAEVLVVFHGYFFIYKLISVLKFVRKVAKGDY